MPQYSQGDSAQYHSPCPLGTLPLTSRRGGGAAGAGGCLDGRGRRWGRRAGGVGQWWGRGRRGQLGTGFALPIAHGVRRDG